MALRGTPQGVMPAAKPQDAATFFLIAGVNARTTTDLMGWTQVTMLTRYRQVTDRLKQDAPIELAPSCGDRACGAWTVRVT